MLPLLWGDISYMATPIANLETVTNNAVSPLPIFNQNILQEESNFATLVKKTYKVHQDTLASGTRILHFIMNADYNGTVDSVSYKTQAGSVAFAVKISGTTVTGCSGSCTTTLNTAYSSANNVFGPGSTVTVDLSTPSSLTLAQFEIHTTLQLPLV